MGDNAISREKRSLPPSDYILRVESFSLLSGSTVDRFESGVFKSGGYNWRLVFYPKGNIKSDGRDNLSLYLKIDDSNSYADDTWSVSVYYKLFVFDQISNQYLVVQDAKGPMRRFDRLKGEWGFGKFLDLSTFNEPSNGYLVDDACAFGAEVYVVKQTSSEQILSLVTGPEGGTFPWSILTFGTLGEAVQCSDEFSVAGRNWSIEDRPGTGNGSPLRNVAGGGGSRSTEVKGSLHPSEKIDQEIRKAGTGVVSCTTTTTATPVNSEQDAAAAAATTTSNPAGSEVISLDNNVDAEVMEWPKIQVSLSRKEKEDDFLAMKGTKLPHKPKKRAKNIDRALQYCCCCHKLFCRKV